MYFILMLRVTLLSNCLLPPSVDNIDVSSTANLYKSLAQAAPEIKQCVDACNFIAESTRQQNDIGSVSVASNFICSAGAQQSVLTLQSIY